MRMYVITARKPTYPTTRFVVGCEGPAKEIAIALESASWLTETKFVEEPLRSEEERLRASRVLEALFGH